MVTFCDEATGPSKVIVADQTGLLMDAEVSAMCGADYRERTEMRTNSRNGYRERAWDTRAGTIELKIPKMREGSPEQGSEIMWRTCL